MVRFWWCGAAVALFLSVPQAMAQDPCVRLGRVDTAFKDRNTVYAEYSFKAMVDNTCNQEKEVRVKVCLYARNGQRLDCNSISALVGAYRIETLYGRVMVDVAAVPYVEEARSTLESN